MPATTFTGSLMLGGTDDNIKRIRGVISQLEAMRTGRMPMTENIAAVLRDNDLFRP